MRHNQSLRDELGHCLRDVSCFESYLLMEQPPFHNSIQRVAGVRVIEEITENITTSFPFIFAFVTSHFFPTSINAFAVHEIC